ncbi:hypothetical protein HPB50_023148 [Hyalomma asiaticum]|uniref:Uncharacterized protein n=1 Tax=Hyalomma asiaticum TaxID=266040 RepID=A0ACB7TPY7_HYAAI|nr:hypothetical protein HPB50_023148 [Hyalomma asiaticum]
MKPLLETFLKPESSVTATESSVKARLSAVLGEGRGCGGQGCCLAKKVAAAAAAWLPNGARLRGRAPARRYKGASFWAASTRVSTLSLVALKKAKFLKEPTAVRISLKCTMSQKRQASGMSLQVGYGLRNEGDLSSAICRCRSIRPDPPPKPARRPSQTPPSRERKSQAGAKVAPSK